MKGKFTGNGEYNILIISGIHGNELTPLVITKKILKNPEQFSDNYKELTVLHAVNDIALKNRSRDIDGFDLNRAFNNTDDWQEENELVLKIKDEIDKADVVIDIHSSASCVELLAIDQNKYATSFCEFADKLNIPYIVQPKNEGTIKNYCINIKKPCFTFEVNKLNEIDIESAKKGFNIISDIVDNIDGLSIKSSDEIPHENKKILTKKDCLILPLVNLGDIIKPNQKIALKIDNQGNTTFLVSNEKKDCKVIVTKYTDYKKDEFIVECNKTENVPLFSIF